MVIILPPFSKIVPFGVAFLYPTFIGYSSALNFGVSLGFLSFLSSFALSFVFSFSFFFFSASKLSLNAFPFSKS